MLMHTVYYVRQTGECTGEFPMSFRPDIVIRLECRTAR